MEKTRKNNDVGIRWCFGILFIIFKLMFHIMIENANALLHIIFRYIGKKAKWIFSVMVYVVIHQNKIAALIVISIWCITNEIHYKTQLDMYAKKSYYDDQRIYRLQNDSIALHNLKSGKLLTPKKQVIYLVKKVFVKPETSKKDTI